MLICKALFPMLNKSIPSSLKNKVHDPADFRVVGKRFRVRIIIRVEEPYQTPIYSDGEIATHADMDFVTWSTPSFNSHKVDDTRRRIGAHGPQALRQCQVFPH